MISRQTSPKVDRLSYVLLLLTLGVGTAVGLVASSIPSWLHLAVMVAGLVGALGILAHLEWGLLILVFMAYMRFSDIAIKYHGAPSTFQPLMLMLLAMVMIRWALYAERPTGWQRSIPAVVGYGLVGFATLLYAADFGRAWNAVEDYLKDATIAIVITLLLVRGATLRRVIWTLLVAGILLGSISVFQQLTGAFGNDFGGFGQAGLQHIVGKSEGHRIAGPIGDPNFYAQILVALVPLALDRLWSERGRFWQLMAGWALIAIGLSIIFTFSRGAFVALLAVVGLMMLRRPPRPLALLLAIIVAIPMLQFVPEEYVERIRTIPAALPIIGEDARAEVSFRGRASEYAVGWLMFAEHPITGVGLDNYPVFYQEYSRRIGLDPRREARAPHSLYLQIAAETGLVGLVAFGAIIWVAYRGIWEARQKLRQAGLTDYADMTAAFGISLAGYLFAGIFLHMAYPRYLWLLVGIALAIPQVAGHELVALRREGS